MQCNSSGYSRFSVVVSPEDWVLDDAGGKIFPGKLCVLSSELVELINGGCLG